MFVNVGIRYRTKKALKKRPSNPSVSLEESNLIGIVLDDASKNDLAIKRFIDELKLKFKVEIISYTADKKIQKGLKDTFSKKDFNWVGKISNKSISNFIKTPFDFLISLNTSTILYVENILALSKAKCRVGVSSEENYQFLDFMILSHSQNTWETTIENIKHYTENIA
jgi:hypothetical protein